MSDAQFNRHPIQLADLKVVSLKIKANLDEDQSVPPEGNFRFFTGNSEYDTDKKVVIVKIGVEMGKKISDESVSMPFDLEVELLGVFEVDEEKFPVKYIDDWAEKNAPLILYPYLREHVNSLTTRAGFGTMLLPLFEVPTFRTQNLNKKNRHLAVFLCL